MSKALVPLLPQHLLPEASGRVTEKDDAQLPSEDGEGEIKL